MHLGILTTSELPERDDDQSILEDALRRAGMPWRMLPWDLPESEFDDAIRAVNRVLVRSPWDYYRDPSLFRARLAAMQERGIAIFNPREILDWNLHKGYLETLRGRGIPVVPTTWVAPTSDGAFDRTSGRWVIKPAVSCGSWRTVCVDASDSEAREAGGRHVAALLEEGREAMIQPFVEAVAEGRERCAVYVGGSLSHAIAKRPRFANDEESVEPYEVSLPERAFCERVLDETGFRERLAYARVDFFAEGTGLVLSELELLEPSLFLRFRPEAATQLVEYLA